MCQVILGGVTGLAVVQKFIGTKEYFDHKEARFPPQDFAIPVAAHFFRPYCLPVGRYSKHHFIKKYCIGWIFGPYIFLTYMDGQ